MDSVNLTVAQLTRLVSIGNDLSIEGHTVEAIDLWVPEKDDYDPELRVIEVTFELDGTGPDGSMGSTWPITKDGDVDV